MSILDQIPNKLSERPKQQTYYLEELHPEQFEMAIIFPITYYNSDLIETMVRNVSAIMEPFGNVFYYETPHYPLVDDKYVNVLPKYEKRFLNTVHGIFQMNIPRQKTTFLKKMIYTIAWISRVAIDGADIFQSTLFFWPEETEHFYSHEYCLKRSSDAYNAIICSCTDSLNTTMDVGILALRLGLVNKAEELNGQPYKLYCFFNDRRKQ